jgi:hypothetical protein
LSVVSRWGKNKFVDQFLPESDTMVEIDLEDANRRPPSGRLAHEYRPIPSKMARPLVASRIEKRDDFSCLGVDTSDVWPFVTVARKTAEAKVARLCHTFVIFCDDVVDLKRNSLVFLRDLAILATVSGSPPYQFLQRTIHACSIRPCLLFPDVIVSLKRSAGPRLQDIQQVTDQFVPARGGIVLGSQRSRASLGG